MFVNIRYTFTVAAVSDAGKSKPSVKYVVDFSNVPDQVRDVRTSGETDSSIILNWSEPSNNGSPIIRYVVKCEQLNSNSNTYEQFKDLNVQGTSRTLAAFDSLQGETSYRFSVIAINAIGESVISEKVYSSTVLAFNTPSEPKNLRETERTESSVTVEFDRPSSDGGKEIEYYLLTVYKLNRSNGLLELVKEETLIQRQYTMNSLEYDSIYNLEVSAYNSVGKGTTSQTLFIHTNNRPTLLMNDLSNIDQLNQDVDSDPVVD